jgi:2,4-dienoyl-CoA reductase-like NADH-dependent reductase (Old Yellow Enzyme family)
MFPSLTGRVASHSLKIFAPRRAALRASFSGTIIGAGGYTPERAEELIRQGHINAAAFGRAFIANPDFINRVWHGYPLAEGKSDLHYASGPEGYSDYPPHPRESTRRYPIASAGLLGWHGYC